MEELEERLPAGPINMVDIALSDPQVLARNMVVETTHRSGQKMKLLGTSIKMSLAGEGPFHSPPALGEHTGQIPKDLLKVTPSEIQRLRDGKVI